MFWPEASTQTTNATASAAPRSMYKRFNCCLSVPHRKSNADAKPRSPQPTEYSCTAFQRGDTGCASKYLKIRDLSFDRLIALGVEMSKLSSDSQELMTARVTTSLPRSRLFLPFARPRTGDRDTMRSTIFWRDSGLSFKRSWIAVGAAEEVIAK